MTRPVHTVREVDGSVVDLLGRNKGRLILSLFNPSKVSVSGSSSILSLKCRPTPTEVSSKTKGDEIRWRGKSVPTNSQSQNSPLSLVWGIKFDE